MTPSTYVPSPSVSPRQHRLCFPSQAIIACRALANLLEAMPHAAPQVAVCAPALCQKVSLIGAPPGPVVILSMQLESIEFIDLAEQAISVLVKLSVEQAAAVLDAV